jgi:hypothetical protein
LTTGLSAQEIDQIVVVQAADDTAWEQPIRAQRTALAALPAELAARDFSGAGTSHPES